MRFDGDMGDGTKAPRQSDKARLDFIDRCSGQPYVKITNKGVTSIGVNVWQPSLRAAIDVAIELNRRKYERVK